ncbi:lamin tail domain-containing protein [Luteolibacter sp. SL250]|uniref:lamin tail domain-containing protein n=1 Tax=Luteolibacter sp. SL250 TaxID=2995170 RepID=UPI002270DA7C|nr:lamin tail domain-containing protein [Luteolibacter sp. SL250]WAC20868.1 lamin tail domain-containing protein [Luteolibacter sp. SL250]
MKSIIPILALLASAVPGGAAIIITEVMSSSLHPSGGSNNGDWFEITNTGSSAVDLTGWTWDDSSRTPGSSNFGSLTVLGAGQSAVICEEPIGSESTWLSDWGITGVIVSNIGGSSFQGLGAGGDEVNIYDASQTLVTRATFGSATGGASFEWNTAGTSLGTSVIGENGAFRAASDGIGGAGQDVGSPGFALVPEPGTTGLALAAGLVALARRNRRG